jgi:hypothetical protein
VTVAIAALLLTVRPLFGAAEPDIAAVFVGLTISPVRTLHRPRISAVA